MTASAILKKKHTSLYGVDLQQSSSAPDRPLTSGLNTEGSRTARSTAPSQLSVPSTPSSSLTPFSYSPNHDPTLAMSLSLALRLHRRPSSSSHGVLVRCYAQSTNDAAALPLAVARPEPTDYDVAIIGGGVVGLALAAALGMLVP